MNGTALFMRLEGPMQAWGSNEAQFGVRRTYGAPTKSGVVGLLCAALGLTRPEATAWLPRLADLPMAVRLDRPPVRWWDYQTVGAGHNMRIAKAAAETKKGPLLSRREYLCDASYLVVLLGDSALVARLADALARPVWPLCLGRKSCPPSRPILERPPAERRGLAEALASVPWRPRLGDDPTPVQLECLMDWTPSPDQAEAPPDALTWYDVPVSFQPPAHRARLLTRVFLPVGAEGGVTVAAGPDVRPTRRPARPRADYGNAAYRRRRAERMAADRGLCVFCKAPATTVQHVTYRHAGGSESLEELRSLCRLCHDAVTTLEYGLGMGIDRIDPVDPQWRDGILAKRREIVMHRSLEMRRRRFAAEEVE